VKRSELEGLGFYDTHKFERSSDFLAHERRAKENTYLLDPRPLEAEWRGVVEVCESEIESSGGSIRLQLEKLHSRKSERRQNDLNVLLAKHESSGDFESRLTSLSEAIAAKRSEIELAAAKTKKEVSKLERSKTRRARLIDTAFTDILRYRWKHKRQIWDVSKAEKYLDFGDSNLYRLLDSDFVQRVPKDSFIEDIRSKQRVPKRPAELPRRISFAKYQSLR
jgi:hypothetical protein